MRTLSSLLKTTTFRDTLISFTGLATTAGLGFLFTIIMARTLGPEKYGIFSAITALSAIIYSLGDVGIPPAIINFLPKLGSKKKELLSTTFIAQSVIAIIAALLFLFLTLFHRQIIPGSQPIHLLLALLVTVNYILIGFAQGVFTAERKFWSYSASQIIDATTRITIIFLLLLFSRLDIGTALMANIASTLLALVLTFGKTILSIQLSFDRSIFKVVLSFAKWIAASRVFSVLIGRVDILLLNLLVSSFSAGIFAAASKITLLFVLLISSLNVVVNPRFSSFTTIEETLSYIKKLFIFIGGIALLMLVSIFLAQPIITVVFGDKYIVAIPVFQYLTLAMIPFLFSLVTIPALIYTFNRPDFYAKITFLQVTILIALEILLIPKFGYFAPVIAVAFSNLLVLLLSSVKLMKLLSLAEISPGRR